MSRRVLSTQFWLRWCVQGRRGRGFSKAMRFLMSYLMVWKLSIEIGGRELSNLVYYNFISVSRVPPPAGFAQPSWQLGRIRGKSKSAAAPRLNPGSSSIYLCGSDSAVARDARVQLAQLSCCSLASTIFMSKVTQLKWENLYHGAVFAPLIWVPIQLGQLHTL